jgi:hypothetical protein
MCLHFLNKQINKGKTPGKGTREKRKNLSPKKDHTQECKMHNGESYEEKT